MPSGLALKIKAPSCRGARRLGRRLRQGTARTFVRSWMAGSDGHRENMLDMNHSRLGVGVAIGRHGKIYAVQAFS